MAGSSGKPLSQKPLSQKLGLKPGFRIFADGPPVDYRKIVGELVVIDVQTRTATAIITRVAGEVHTGDLVEIQ